MCIRDRRLEDVKKYLYAGARAVFLDGESEENIDIIKEAADLSLIHIWRTDLIGYDKKCLIRPRGGKNEIQKGGSPKTGKPQVVSRPKASRPKKTIRNVHKKKG